MDPRLTPMRDVTYPPIILTAKTAFKVLGQRIELTGTANAALWGFLLFYLSCAALTWLVYSGPKGMLHGLERGGRRKAALAHAAKGSTS